MRLPALAALACALLAAPAFADDGMRCGQWLVAAGAGQGEVRAKCGPPTDAHTEDAFVETDYGTMHYTVDVWTYNRGPTEFMRRLRFRSGVLVRVDVGSWGY